MEELPVVIGDVRKLRQVFLNLISNAVKFADDTPAVRISAEVADGVAVFAIADNGIGMDPAHADRIFQPFQRLHDEDSYPGSGIGLAVCERIVEQHGGRIWVTSTPGEGSTFRFTLPVAERRGAQVAPLQGGAAG